MIVASFVLFYSRLNRLLIRIIQLTILISIGIICFRDATYPGVIVICHRVPSTLRHKLYSFLVFGLSCSVSGYIRAQ